MWQNEGPCPCQNEGPWLRAHVFVLYYQNVSRFTEKFDTMKKEKRDLRYGHYQNVTWT
jgi:hypothetical protein